MGICQAPPSPSASARLDFARVRTKGRVSEVSDCSGRRLCVGRSRFAVARRAVAVPSDQERPARRGRQAEPDRAGAAHRRRRSPTSPGSGTTPASSASAAGRRRPPPGTPVQATFWNIEAGIQGRPAVHAVGRRAPPAAHGGQQQGQPRRRVPAARPHAAAHALAAAEDHSDQGSDRHHLRGQRQRAADLHSTAAPRRPTIRSRGGTAIRAAGGKATRWSSRRRTSATRDGSTSTARR